MDQKPKMTSISNNTAKSGGAYGAGSLTAGSANISAATSSVPAGNNPRIDLLHNAGANTMAQPAASAASIPRAAAAPVDMPAPPMPKMPPAPTPLPAAPRAHKSKKGLVITLVLLLIALTGGGVWWWMNRSVEPVTETPSPIALTALEPTKLGIINDKNSAVAAGGATNGAKLTFSVTLETTANSGSATPEIEVQPLGTPFTNTPTHTGEAVTANGSDMTLSTSVDGLIEGGYHWQARTAVDGQNSNWVAAGDGAKADFIVDTTAPALPILSTFDGKPSGSSLTTTNTKPAFAGKTEPNATILITIDQQKLTATADEVGAWQTTATTEIVKGTYNVTVVATDIAGNSSGPLALALVISEAATAQQTPPAPAPAPAEPAAQPTELAKTGDSVAPTSAAAALLLGISLTCIVLMRRYGWR